jgi:hypothetical protein
MEASEMVNPATTGQQRRPAQKAAPRKTAQKTTTRPRTTTRAPRSRASSGEGLHVHTAHPKVPIPYLTPGDMSANVRAVGSKMPPLPPPKRLAFYGGLGALAAFGAVDWPVALAIGAAAVVARGGRRNGSGNGGEHAS